MAKKNTQTKSKIKMLNNIEVIKVIKINFKQRSVN